MGARGAMMEVAGDVEPRAADDASGDSSGFCVGGVGGAGDNASTGLQNVDAYLAGVSDSDADLEVGRRSMQGVGTSARARRLRELALAARMYQPEEVRADRCQALLWNGGKGKRQCRFQLLAGGDLCGKHKKENAVHGRVRGPIPAQ